MAAKSLGKGNHVCAGGGLYSERERPLLNVVEFVFISGLDGTGGDIKRGPIPRCVLQAKARMPLSVKEHRDTRVALLEPSWRKGGLIILQGRATTALQALNVHITWSRASWNRATPAGCGGRHAPMKHFVLLLPCDASPGACCSREST